ncbi:restless-like transposase [Beauveria bassiana ARSEF 2860]|uniref:Restless-like transposase n=1 Tax=Beauveria bassiana (strain ARSEF 2860) TaxID=655819 RepID=J4VS05_BEAB2|nr:restless-like transposase [Beauveria bassiana ARSEF 2860]EJP61390.1 restless-like transposase [Beauveria bassiana ARSEF 2860]
MAGMQQLKRSQWSNRSDRSDHGLEKLSDQTKSWRSRPDQDQHRPDHSDHWLHPAYRWDWFAETWSHKPSWVTKAKQMVADVWLSDYAHLEVGTTSSRSDDEPPAKRSRFFNPFEKNSRLPSSTPAYATTIMGDEYQAWQTDREVGDSNVRDPIRYWITKKGRYPRLSRMALDFLTIQPMSAECERLFSAAGKMVSALRTDLDAEIIGICQVLRSWYRAGLIKDLDPLLHSHVEAQLDGVYATLSDNELTLAESKWLRDGEDSASEGGDTVLQQPEDDGFEPCALRRSPGQIHIAFAGARVFRDEDNQLRKLVLGIPELVERHSGENIAADIIDIIRSFGTEDKGRYFTLDNAANNDTAMREIAQELHFDAVRWRVRCVGHILNLVVKSLLFEKDVEAFEDTVAKGEALARAAHDTWVRRGPVGKAHNFAVWVHRSDVLTLLRQIQQDSFAAADNDEIGKQRPFDVVIDNDTRWLSQYYMIKRLVRLQPFYEEFVA